MLTVENPEQAIREAPCNRRRKTVVYHVMFYKFCFGKGGFGKERQRVLIYRKYSNVDCFTSIEDLAETWTICFVAQYIVEFKEVVDDGKNLCIETIAFQSIHSFYSARWNILK